MSNVGYTVFGIVIGHAMLGNARGEWEILIRDSHFSISF